MLWTGRKKCNELPDSLKTMNFLKNPASAGSQEGVVLHVAAYARSRTCLVFCTFRPLATACPIYVGASGRAGNLEPLQTDYV